MNIINVQENKNNVIKKANELIKAKGELSGTAQKMLAMLISMIRADDTEFQIYALKIDDYKKEIGAENKEKEFYVNKALELMQNPFYVIDENGKRKFFNWCSMVDPDSMDGYILMQTHNNLLPYLLQLKSNFTEYNIINIMKLKGKYSPRLYEYLKMEWNQYKAYHKTANSYALSIEIDWLRDFLKIGKGYRYNDIKKQILDKAKKDFKEFTDIQFDYKEKEKVRKKVISIEIIIKDNNKGSADHLVTRKAFINYIRKNYKPDPANNIFPTVLETDKGNIKIDLNGRLYILLNNGNIDELDEKRADNLWNWLYETAKAGNLPCI